MKKVMDKFKSKIRTNKKFTIFLFLLILIGVVFGSLFITILSDTDKSMIKDYLNDYIMAIENNKLVFSKVLINSLLNDILIGISIWLLGFSVVGIPVVLFLFFTKTFTLGFSIASIFYTYKIKGFYFTFLYVFPHQIINLLTYSILITYTLSVSFKLIESIFRKKNIDFKIIMEKYTVVLGIVFASFIFTSLYETFILPKLLKLIIPFLT